MVLSGQSDETNARHARTLGAIEFVAKPCEPETLKTLLNRALEVREAELGAAAEGGLLGKSLLIEKLRQQISQFANAPVPGADRGRIRQRQGAGRRLAAPA